VFDTAKGMECSVCVCVCVHARVCARVRTCVMSVYNKLFKFMFSQQISAYQRHILPGFLPPTLHTLLSKCLQKDWRSRLTALEAMYLLGLLNCIHWIILYEHLHMYVLLIKLLNCLAVHT